MFEVADFLLPFYKDLLAQDEFFLISRGADTTYFSVTPVGRAIGENEILSIRYDSTDFVDGDYLALIRANTKSGLLEARAGLRTALNLLTYVFDSSMNADELGTLHTDLSVSDAALHFGLDGQELCTPDVGSYAPGFHIAKVDERSMLYFVEDRGESFPVAEAVRPAILVYMVHASARRTATDVAGRSARSYHERQANA